MLEERERGEKREEEGRGQEEEEAKSGDGDHRCLGLCDESRGDGHALGGLV